MKKVTLYIAILLLIAGIGNSDNVSILDGFSVDAQQTNEAAITAVDTTLQASAVNMK